jgi:hypothetical protein
MGSVPTRAGGWKRYLMAGIMAMAVTTADTVPSKRQDGADYPSCCLYSAA